MSNVNDYVQDPTPYSVICQGDSIPGQKPCGRVFLDESEYMKQLGRPDNGWYCPHCGSSAQWDNNSEVTR